MKIALVGGTGDLGSGFAVRWAASHEIMIGSRRSEKAALHAEMLTSHLGSLGVQSRIRGMDNASAILDSEVVVLCVPFDNLGSVTTDLRSSYSQQVVISPVVPMIYGKYFEFVPPAEGSAAQLVKASLPDGVKVVSAFHIVPAASLKDLAISLKADIPICGDDIQSKGVVAGLCEEIRDLRPLDAGPLTTSHQLEGLTPLLLNIARLNRLKQVTIQFVQAR